MSTSTFTISYTHSVTYVTTKMLLLLKEIIREIGLDPAQLTEDWPVLERGVAAWLGSRHLEQVRLEVYDPKTDALVTAWDLDVVYSTVGDGSLWVDTAAIRYNIVKHGLSPATCRYDIKVTTKAGRPAVNGWSSCSYRSTEGFQRYSIGATIGGNGLATQTAYWGR